MSAGHVRLQTYLVSGTARPGNLVSSRTVLETPLALGCNKPGCLVRGLLDPCSGTAGCLLAVHSKALYLKSLYDVPERLNQGRRKLGVISCKGLLKHHYPSATLVLLPPASSIACTSA